MGFALGVIVTATLGAALKQGSEIGRFQISAGGHYAYVVDTMTGQVWPSNPNSKTFREKKIKDPGL